MQSIWLRTTCLAAVLLSSTAGACTDDDNDTTPAAGTSGSTGVSTGGSKAGAGGDAKVDTTCPADTPAVGGACKKDGVCWYLHGGPCARPVPDEGRSCFNGKWTPVKPAIACPDAGDDAGS